MQRRKSEASEGLAEERGHSPELQQLAAEAARFESAIAESPEQAEHYLAYGHWLAAQGDPLGELATVQASLVKKSRDAALLARQRELFDLHSATWLGGLDAEEGFDAEWRLGFIDVVELGREEPCSLDALEALEVVFGLPAGRFLRELVLGDCGSDDAAAVDLSGVVAALTKWPPPRTLRRLVLEPKRVAAGMIQIGDVSALLAKLKPLEVLSLTGVVSLGKIDLPELTTFKLRTRATKAVVRSVAGARWPKLSQLVLGFGNSTDGAAPSDLAPILEGSGTPLLTHLGLQGLPFADDVVGMLKTAKLLPRLHLLDLSKGMLTRTGAEALLQMRGALSGLEDLDLSGNVLPTDVVSALTAHFGERLSIDEGNDRDPVDVEDEDEDEDDDGERNDELPE